ncbi:MAG: hypothetical protein ACI4RG_10685 [Huintestinicola sp.]
MGTALKDYKAFTNSILKDGDNIFETADRVQWDMIAAADRIEDIDVIFSEG